MNAIQKAMADSDRSYIAAKSAVGNATQAMLADGPSGVETTRTDLSNASEQLKHFRGWVYASVRAIAQRIAGQPIHVGKPKRRPRLGTKALTDAEPLESHELLDLLADPNDLMVSWSLIYVTVASLELTGRQLWWITDVDGREQILPIPTSWIVGFDGSTKITAFRVRPPKQGVSYPIPADECCYFHYPDPGDPRGATSPLQAVGGAVDSDEAIEISRSAMFRQGIHSTHAIRLGKNPSPDIAGGLRPRLNEQQQRQIISAVKRRYAGIHKNEPLILDGMIEDISKLSNTPAEMDYLGSEKSTKARITQGFGVNPIILGEIEGANRASSTEADRHFCEYTINPKIRLISEVLTEWLGKPRGVVIWVEPCVPHDTEMAHKWAETLSKHGVITAHELRKLSPFDLPEDSAFNGVMVGGRDMGTTGKIESGLRQMVFDAVGSVEADKILGELNHGQRSALPSGNGNGRH